MALLVCLLRQASPARAAAPAPSQPGFVPCVGLARQGVRRVFLSESGEATMIGADWPSTIVQLIAIIFVAAPGIALGRPPVSTGNIWHHEPTPAQFRRAERVEPILPVPGPRPATTA